MPHHFSVFKPQINAQHPWKDNTNRNESGGLFVAGKPSMSAAAPALPFCLPGMEEGRMCENGGGTEESIFPLLSLSVGPSC